MRTILSTPPPFWALPAPLFLGFSGRSWDFTPLFHKKLWHIPILATRRSSIFYRTQARLTPRCRGIRHMRAPAPSSGSLQTHKKIPCHQGRGSLSISSNSKRRVRHECRLWRPASYIKMAEAMAALRDSTLPHIGMRI